MDLGVIYENLEPKNRNPAGVQSQNRGEAQNSKKSRWFVPITVCLGLICVLLVIALILLYIHLTAQRDQIKMKYMNIDEKYNKTLSNLNDEKEELQERVSRLSRALESFFPGLNRYYISSEEKSWADSRRFCNYRYEDLIIINTEEEQRFITSLLINERVWIGLSDIKNKVNGTWVDDTPLNKAFWYQGEPNNLGENEDCVEIWSSIDTLNNWNDSPCSGKKKFICEKQVSA